MPGADDAPEKAAVRTECPECGEIAMETERFASEYRTTGYCHACGDSWESYDEDGPDGCMAVPWGFLL